jgi:hypothetical protein
MRTSLMERVLVVAFFAFGLFANASHAQSTNAAIGGQITDEQGRVVPSVSVSLTNLNTGLTYEAKTNGDGFYNAPNLPPGVYRANVTKDGFKSIVKGDIELHVQDVASINFQLQIGSVSETVTVTAGGLVINTTDATVSTIVDRQFAENLPMNGRSFQTLIELTPGVVLTAPTSFDGGQFSVNGQRPVSNYWMVDGVSANFGASPIALPGNGSAGALPAFSVLGGTNSLVSVDAMQEFRIQTSTFAPEFGRTPGGQISIVTRSGTNQFHGTAFDYLRNDALDASNWFNGYTNTPALPKAKERQNDFGGTFSGPVIKDKTFFFFSYEGLRLRLPQTTLTTVPDASFTPGGTTNARQTALPALQPYLNAYPLPNANSPEIFTPCDPTTDPTCPSTGKKATGTAAFNASYSNPASLDAYSLRIDQKLGGKLMLFGRYNYSPSELAQRGQGVSLNGITRTSITTQTLTIGTTWAISSQALNELRFNYSRTNAQSFSLLDNFGGAIPLTSLPFPSGFTNQNAEFSFVIGSLMNGQLGSGRGVLDLQRQFNLVDGLSVQRGSHNLKFGVDLRRLSPLYNPAEYRQEAFFADMPSAGAGNLFFGFVTAATKSALLFHNLGIFAQDTWRIAPRLTLTYGLRWDVDFAPSSANGPSLPAVTGFNLSNLSSLALAPTGTPPFGTTYGNFAPRLGVAYQLSQNQNWEAVFRGGFGVFYDLATSQVGNMLQTSFPFGGESFIFGGAFPLSAASAAPPPITASSLASEGTLFAVNPNLRLPYTLEWNATLEQAVGRQQKVSLSYVGADGRRLIQSAYILEPNPNFSSVDLVGNTARSNYNALQLQFQRRLSHGLQALASYTWSHSIDDGSAGSYGNSSNLFVPGTNRNANRGPSDFDIRNAVSAGLTYEIPTASNGIIASALLHGWSLQSFVLSTSAPPEDIFYEFTFNPEINGAATNIRPDVVPGKPLYLYGDQYPGGKAFNPSAFTPPPADSSGNPLRQGDLGRNTLRAFDVFQWDFALHRDFPVHERLKLQFRAEMFNVLNHPNFGPPLPEIDAPGFGLATKMLGQSLGGIGGVGGFNPLYQIGGPRSIQFALKLMF